jgi:hypothetical protein
MVRRFCYGTQGLLHSSLHLGEILMGYQYTLEDLFVLMRPHAPAMVDALRGSYRSVEYGLLSVGLKIHCIGEDNPLIPLMSQLGGMEVLKSAYGYHNHYRHQRAALTVVLPPVGNARAAILLLECIGKTIGADLFNNKFFHLQVCSPGRLKSENAALLAVGFYLGSDTLRDYELNDFKTTFSELGDASRGRRIVLYDAKGTFDREFEWWGARYVPRRKPKKGRRTTRALQKQRILPYASARTDLLVGATSRLDVKNINLLATLLSHHEQSGWWQHLGREFRNDVWRLLRDHQVVGALSAPWVHSNGSTQEDDELFGAALQEIKDSAFEEAALHRDGQEPRGLLYGMDDLLTRFRARLEYQACNISARGEL